MTEQEFRTIVAEKIAYYRKAAGMTQGELAAKLNYSDKSVSKWERADGVPDAFVLSQIAELFGVTVNDLISDSKPLPYGKNKKRRNFITVLSVGICWLSAAVLYFILQVLPFEIQKTWIVFVYALVPTFIVLTVFSCIWYRLRHRALSISGIVWSVFVSLILTFKAELVVYFLVPCVIFQIMIIIWFIMKYKTK